MTKIVSMSKNYKNERFFFEKIYLLQKFRDTIIFLHGKNIYSNLKFFHFSNFTQSSSSIDRQLKTRTQVSKDKDIQR